MQERMPCVACGKLSPNFLFKDKALGVHICSKKCEHEYLKNLSHGTSEHTNIVQYLDRRIAEYRKRNKILWGLSAAGILLLLFGFLIPEVTVFIAGNIIAVLGALGTRNCEHKIGKLTIQRKRLAI